MAEPPVRSVDKALVVLQLLGDRGPEGLSLVDVAQALGSPKSGAHLTLSALRHRGFVTQDRDSGRYRLGGEALRVAASYEEKLSFRTSLLPLLRRLSEEIRQVCHLGVLDGADIVYLEKVHADRPVQVGSKIGGRNPAATTALGRAILAYQGWDEAGLRAQLGDPGDLTWARLREVLARTRERGYALDVEENEPGIACVAVPVLLNGEPCCALSISTLAAETDSDVLAGYVARLHALAEQYVSPPLRLP
ncbi:DNA-binding IclR family transcriptional regulator [Amycolatopsis bartoniae]|uniref:Glycerol operon regulatory protein n=1 Tax=Amycolatopsis bartoniae TaxID=941986 RepID=A0A8H9M3P3_9PSEU|nr:IclR family transcriptional regulator [Amycolatopsis bartoniae]MBB2937743.1 DNA-binding IclR family transcriptional regulator [Amycolatopsis bartoniae]TVT08177.1 IclR family transcriptional regulator [Amycolatopsis bartoniae]GHF40387.1 transcriptional regulator [Amycolatopsis bartoniae]